MKVVLLAVAILISCSLPAQTFRWDNEQAPRKTTETISASSEMGVAMIYPDYYEGSPTALGDIFSQNNLTGAHKKLPLGTLVQVTRLDNGQSVQIRINDRGAYCDDCIVDLTKAAAGALGMLEQGQAEVRLTVLGEIKSAPAESSLAQTGSNGNQMTARGVEPAQQQIQRRLSPPPPNSYGNTQPRTPVTVAAAEVPSSNSTGTADFVVSGEYVADPAMSRVENGITILSLPISPFTVQFGAYAKRSNADRHARRLLDAGFDNVFLLVEENRAEQPLHRVVTAPFATVDEAKAYVNAVRAYHDMKALVFETKLVEVKD